MSVLEIGYKFPDCEVSIAQAWLIIIKRPANRCLEVAVEDFDPVKLMPTEAVKRRRVLLAQVVGEPPVAHCKASSDAGYHPGIVFRHCDLPVQSSEVVNAFLVH